MIERRKIPRTRTAKCRALLGTVVVAILAWIASPAAAQLYRPPESDVNPALFAIDQKKVLGFKVNPALALITANGQPTTLGQFVDRPTVLVFSYYECDGSCSLINDTVRRLLTDMRAVGLRMGADFKVLTLSFDPNDTLATMNDFADHTVVSTTETDGWSFAVARDSDQLKATTAALDYRYFWSVQDRTFFHPPAVFFLSAEGRVVRVLYTRTANGDGVTGKDVELALLDARQGRFKASELVSYAISLCYSYNYKEGRYTFNIPLFVAAGSLALGVSAFSVSAVVFHRRRKRDQQETAE